MKDEIRLIIEKNLPAQVGETLKSVLDEGEKNAKTVKEQAIFIEKQSASIKELEGKIDNYRKFDTRNSELDNRQLDIETKEKLFEINSLRYKLESEIDKTKFSRDLALGLVRNTEFRRNLFDNVNSPDGIDQYGNRLYSNKTQTSTETKTAD